MERKEFLKCRDELVHLLESYSAENYELAEVCAAALNELFADTHFVASVQLHDKISFTGNTWIAE